VSCHRDPTLVRKGTGSGIPGQVHVATELQLFVERSSVVLSEVRLRSAFSRA